MTPNHALQRPGHRAPVAIHALDVRPIRTVMPLRTFMFLITLTCLIGCQSQRPAAEQREASFLDEQKFAKIMDYYRKTFPAATFASGRNIHMTDGPNGERLHINVPVAVDAEYQHPYAPAFLAKQSTSADGLARTIADDLLLLRKERLFTRPSRVGYGGEVMVDCITYVVNKGVSPEWQLVKAQAFF
jgi:hypothetical protein